MSATTLTFPYVVNISPPRRTRTTRRTTTMIPRQYRPPIPGRNRRPRRTYIKRRPIRTQPHTRGHTITQQHVTRERRQPQPLRRMRNPRPRINEHRHMRTFPTDHRTILIRQRLIGNINQRIMTTLRWSAIVTLTRFRHRRFKSQTQRVATQRIKQPAQKPHAIRDRRQLHPTLLLMLLLHRRLAQRVVTQRHPLRNRNPKILQRQRRCEPQQHLRITLQEGQTTPVQHLRDHLDMRRPNHTRSRSISPTRQLRQHQRMTNTRFALRRTSMGVARQPLRHVPKPVITNNR